MDHDTCPICESADLPKRATGPRATYCSLKCRREAARLRGFELRRDSRATRPDVIRTCSTCAETFLAPTKRGRPPKYCSKACVPNVRDSKTRICGLEGCEKPLRAKGLCGYHYNRANYSWRERSGNPETRRKRLRAKTQQRRAAASDPRAERICRDDVGERDNWLCGLCGESVDNETRWPEAMSPSLDHILPLSRGGLHQMSNVQIAHLACNMAKGNRVQQVTPSKAG